MELLKIIHQDFEMIIECSKFDGIWEKAKRNVGEENLSSTYSWSDGVESVQRVCEDGYSKIENGASAPAIFFDNADYPIWVEFNKDVSNASFGSILESDNQHFTFRRGMLAGFLNYGNDIGKSEINITYRRDEKNLQFTFQFEVLSTKLNYHEHWKKIIEDIEEEYRMLSFDFMKRTFHGFSIDNNGENSDLIWWSIFSSEQEDFINSAKSIIERPRHRLQNFSTYQRADKLRRLTAITENELAEHRNEPAHLYRVPVQVPSNDTQENRFLKHALKQITIRFDAIKDQIEKIGGLSTTEKKKIESQSTQLNQLAHNPFFRTIGPFKGFAQESLVLQKASGYSKVYKIWNLLRRAYSLYDGIYRLQTKDIATLYEIWCFIEVSHIVKEQLHLSDNDIDHRNRMEMNGLFTWELGKGEHSRILFKKDNVELAELVYNPKHTEKENDSISIENIYVPTVAQKPDIVLQLTKNDLHKDMKMTYLFDAKYRIDGRDSRGVDTPPEDAINQMHRYRDAIYYKDHSSEELKKEVVGGYILFPGDGAPADVEVSKFYETIDEVNIGAFPLRPKDERNRKLLEEFIKELIDRNASQLLSDTIPQKGLYYSEQDLTYFIADILGKNNDRSVLENGTATKFICSRKGPMNSVDISRIGFFAPVCTDNLIMGYYKVLAINSIEVTDDDYPIRLEFSLGEYTKLSSPAKYGIHRLAARGISLSKSEFKEHCKIHAVLDTI